MTLRTDAASYVGCAVAFVLTLATVQPAFGACARSRAPDGTARFELKGAEVVDRLSGLVWQRCSLGLTWTKDGGCTGDRTFVTHPDATAAAEQAGNGWRLPTADELAELVDQECGRPAIDTKIFPDVTASTDEGAEEYWTSTPGGIEDMVYFIEFSDGYSDIRSPGFERHARFVRTPK